MSVKPSPLAVQIMVHEDKTLGCGKNVHLVNMHLLLKSFFLYIHSQQGKLNCAYDFPIHEALYHWSGVQDPWIKATVA